MQCRFLKVFISSLIRNSYISSYLDYGLGKWICDRFCIYIYYYRGFKLHTKRIASRVSFGTVNKTHIHKNRWSIFYLQKQVCNDCLTLGSIVDNIYSTVLYCRMPYRVYIGQAIFLDVFFYVLIQHTKRIASNWQSIWCAI